MGEVCKEKTVLERERVSERSQTEVRHDVLERDAARHGAQHRVAAGHCSEDGLRGP
jgi:hypothetical protein